MSEVSTYFCEGDLDCPNKVTMGNDEFGAVRNNDACILCPTCKPRYEHLNQKENMELGFNDIK